MVKVISLSNDAYAKLKALKKGSQSFSDVVVEVTSNKKKRNIMDFAGAFADNAEHWEKMEKQIYEDRKKAKMRDYKF